tara:strand:+ start:90 stop:323 length:234 start_codon:yes stop_codon:yes gene_type:complete
MIALVILIMFVGNQCHVKQNPIFQLVMNIFMQNIIGVFHFVFLGGFDLSWLEEWFPSECIKCMKFGKDCTCEDDDNE